MWNLKEKNWEFNFKCKVALAYIVCLSLINSNEANNGFTLYTVIHQWEWYHHKAECDWGHGAGTFGGSFVFHSCFDCGANNYFYLGGDIFTNLLLPQMEAQSKKIRTGSRGVPKRPRESWITLYFLTSRAVTVVKELNS